MPDGVIAAAELATASSSGSVPKRRPGRPRKTEVDGRSDSTADKGAATQKHQRPTAKRARAATKMAVTAADVPCRHENCQRPTGDPDWVTCSRCNRWYHDICLNYTPNHDDWGCGCP
ncbi:hypothetical protein AAVH_25166 [Aphelenchoides avenae]|nr:hypothetical protein AAVH_25166 [Aphelenchus avenae]